MLQWKARFSLLVVALASVAAFVANYDGGHGWFNYGW
jgi:hypothetical protein